MLTKILTNRSASYWLFSAAGFSGAIALSWLISQGREALAVIICAYLVIFYLAIQGLEFLLLFWLALSPLAACYLRYPYEQSVITFDRVTICLMAYLAIRRLMADKTASLSLNLVSISWLIFGLYALGDCLVQGSPSLVSLKMAMDGFLLPVILLVIIENSPTLVPKSETIFKILLGLGYFLPIVGLYELATGQDLLAYPGGELFHDGTIRPNGPFLSDNSYALISLIIGLMLIYWPRIANIRVVSPKIWRGAILSALLASLLPQFRAVALAMVGALLLGQLLLYGKKALIKPLIVILLVVAASLPIGLSLKDTKFYQGRIADSTNISSRFVTYQAAFEIIKDNWLKGVGIGGYEAYFIHRYGIKELPEDKAELSQLAQTTPHNNFLAVLAELGIIGFILYLIAHATILYRAWRLYQQGAIVAATTIILLLLVYTGVGLTLTSGYYSDLNLIFLACLGFISIMPRPEPKIILSD